MGVRGWGVGGEVRHCFRLKAACYGGLRGSVCFSARLKKLRRIISVSHNHRCYTRVYSCCIRALTVHGAANPEEAQAAWCGHTPGTVGSPDVIAPHFVLTRALCDVGIIILPSHQHGWSHRAGRCSRPGSSLWGLCPSHLDTPRLQCDKDTYKGVRQNNPETTVP